MSTDHRSVLSTAPLWRALLHLCVPMMAGFIVGAVYNIINAGFIGTLHSTALLAALTFSLPVFALIMAVGGVFGVGGGTLMSRLMGSEEAGGTPAGSASASPAASAASPATEARIRAVSSFTFWGALAAGAVLAVVGVLFATPIAQAGGASGETLAPTALYIALMFGFCPVYVVCFALEQVVRAEGAAVASMTGLIASTVANLVFDVLFILILGWGVAGAGLALGLSNVVMAGYYLWWIAKRSRHASVSSRDLRVDGPMVREVMGVGASELLQSSFLIVTTLVMNWVAVGYGAALLAAMGVALRIAQLPEMIGMGVFMGIIPLLAYAHGAGNVERLRRAVLASAAAIPRHRRRVLRRGVPLPRRRLCALQRRPRRDRGRDQDPHGHAGGHALQRADGPGDRSLPGHGPDAQRGDPGGGAGGALHPRGLRRAGAVGLRRRGVGHDHHGGAVPRRGADAALGRTVGARGAGRSGRT